MKKEKKTQEQINAETTEIARLRASIKQKICRIPEKFNQWSFQEAVRFKDTVAEANSAPKKSRQNLSSLAQINKELTDFYA